MEVPPIITTKDDLPTTQSMMSMVTVSSVEDPPEKKDSMDTKTKWSEIYLATFITFLCAVENNMISIGEWNYLKLMDHDADSTFFASVTSITKGGHAIFALMFAYWSHRWRVSKLPLLVGRLTALLGCILYLLIEYIPTHRRFAMLFCYCLFGISFGTSPILRAFISRMSSNKSRSTAYALLTTASVFSVIIGPMAQLAFAGIVYPGYEILPNMWFHIYSAPIWVALLTNVLAITVIQIRFNDPWENEGNSMKKSESEDTFTLEGIKNKMNTIRNLPLPWLLIGIVLFLKMIANVTLSTLFSVAGPIMTDVFAFEGPTTTKIQAISQLIVGILALGISSAFMFCKLNKKISAQALLLFSMFITVILYLVSYPWAFPPFSVPMQPRNESLNTGCSDQSYPWCETARAPNPIIWLGVMIIAMGFTFPTGSIGLDTLYSKILGPIDQNLMQGVIILAEDLVFIFGPMYASTVFKHFSVGTLWISNAVIASIGLIAFLSVYRRFTPYR